MNPIFLFPVLYSVLVSFTTDGASLPTTTIQVTAPTNWGTWGEWELCSAGRHVVAFQLKTEKDQGGNKDDTALNGIQLQCADIGSGRDDSSVHSKVGDWGDWGAEYRCPSGSALTGFRLRGEKDQGRGDDTAANNLTGFCRSSTTQEETDSLTGDGLSWGDWSARRDCPRGYAICGIKTQVEDNQGSGDDTALNNVAMQCCPL